MKTIEGYEGPRRRRHLLDVEKDAIKLMNASGAVFEVSERMAHSGIDSW